MENYELDVHTHTLASGHAYSTISEMVNEAKNKGLKVSWKKVSRVSGYQIKYSLKKSFKKSKTLTLTYKKHSKFIKKLKKNKIYYVKIRTFKKVHGYVLYSNWSKSKKRKTK